MTLDVIVLMLIALALAMITKQPEQQKTRFKRILDEKGYIFE